MSYIHKPLHQPLSPPSHPLPLLIIIFLLFFILPRLVKLRKRQPYTKILAIQVWMRRQGQHECLNFLRERLSIVSRSEEDTRKGFSCRGEVFEEFRIRVQALNMRKKRWKRVIVVSNQLWVPSDVLTKQLWYHTLCMSRSLSCLARSARVKL